MNDDTQESPPTPADAGEVLRTLQQAQADLALDATRHHYRSDVSARARQARRQIPEPADAVVEQQDLQADEQVYQPPQPRSRFVPAAERAEAAIRAMWPHDRAKEQELRSIVTSLKDRGWIGAGATRGLVEQIARQQRAHRVKGAIIESFHPYGTDW
jgi:hypothetical protein